MGVFDDPFGKMDYGIEFAAQESGARGVGLLQTLVVALVVVVLF